MKIISLKEAVNVDSSFTFVQAPIQSDERRQAAFYLNKRVGMCFNCKVLLLKAFGFCDAQPILF
jgi:hypothetical protein